MTEKPGIAAQWRLSRYYNDAKKYAVEFIMHYAMATGRQLQGEAAFKELYEILKTEAEKRLDDARAEQMLNELSESATHLTIAYLARDPDIYADIVRGTEWSTPSRTNDLSKKIDNMHATMRLGQFSQHMEDWLKAHPDATDEQKEASARRYAAMIGSKPSFFKRCSLTYSLSKRTDLEVSL
jgi:hypothetical protein